MALTSLFLCGALASALIAAPDAQALGKFGATGNGDFAAGVTWVAGEANAVGPECIALGTRTIAFFACLASRWRGRAVANFDAAISCRMLSVAA